MVLWRAGALTKHQQRTLSAFRLPTNEECSREWTRNCLPRMPLIMPQPYCGKGVSSCEGYTSHVLHRHSPRDTSVSASNDDKLYEMHPEL